MTTISNEDRCTKTALIDWITATYHFPPAASQAAAWERVCRLLSLRGQSIHTVSKRGYNSGREFDQANMYIHTERPEQGISVDLTGSHLRKARDEGFDEEIIRQIQATSDKITRLDLAIDLEDSGLTLFKFLKAWREERTKTWATKVLPVTEHTKRRGVTGETIYYGSRTSNRYIRVYNKALEQGVSADWLRIELVLKHPRSTKALEMLTNGGNITSLVRSQIHDYVWEWGVDDLDEILEGEMLEIEPVGRKQTDTTSWLIDTVIPLIGRQLVDGNEAVRDALYRCLERKRL